MILQLKKKLPVTKFVSVTKEGNLSCLEVNTVFFNILGVVHPEYLPVAQMINQYFYQVVLEH
jgi:hypothetical protein